MSEIKSNERAFHVKQFLRSLANAKLAKDNVQDLLDVDMSGNAPQFAHRETHVLGDELRKAARDRTPKRFKTILKSDSVALAS